MAPLCLVFAMSDARVIGKENGLPWNIPEDLQHFKRATLDHAIIMGRVTYDTVGAPLPRRRNIIVSRDVALRREGAEVVPTLEAALALAYATDTEPRVIGGAMIYELALPLATRLLATFVHREVVGDTVFPVVDWSAWKETSRRRADTAADVEFVEYVRAT